MLAKIVRALKRSRQQNTELAQWQARGYAAPSPSFVKKQVLARHCPENVTWVETGTYQGSTTAFLASRSDRVISIEPEPTLFRNAMARFQSERHVTILNGLSEELLPRVVADLTGNVAFWLDGHYSAGVTFKGEQFTPILAELAAVGAALPRLGRVTVLVDDIRCFETPEEGVSHYPERRVLVDWALEHGLHWQIEHDIFVAKNFR